MKYEIGIFVKDWEEDSEESKDYQNLACRTGIRQLILCRGVYTFYFLCFLWSTYHKHSGQEVIHFKYVPLRWTFTVIF